MMHIGKQIPTYIGPCPYLLPLGSISKIINVPYQIFLLRPLKCLLSRQALLNDTVKLFTGINKTCEIIVLLNSIPIRFAMNLISSIHPAPRSA